MIQSRRTAISALDGLTRPSSLARSRSSSSSREMKNTWLQKNLHFYYSDVRIYYSTQCVTRTRIHRRPRAAPISLIRARFRSPSIWPLLFSAPRVPRGWKTGAVFPVGRCRRTRSGNERARRAATDFFSQRCIFVTIFRNELAGHRICRPDNHFVAPSSKRKCGIRASIKNSSASNAMFRCGFNTPARWLSPVIGDIVRVNLLI